MTAGIPFPDRPVDERKSLEILAQGGLPLRAQRRIHETVASERPFFTSTLTPSEMVVASLTGLDPVSQVMGSSIYHVGFRQYVSSSAGGELTTMTAAYDHARSLALSRMQAEAALLRAHLVLDVRFLSRGFHWASDLMEFNAIGTAVRIRNGGPPPERPVLSLLEPDELLKVHNAGYWPVGIAIGNCFWFDPHADCAAEGSWYSQELPKHTIASQQARHISVQRFHQFAAHFNADGVVGVRVNRHGNDHEYEYNNQQHTSFHLNMVVMGTAVVRRKGEVRIPQPKLVVDLRDLPSVNDGHGTLAARHSSDIR